LLITLSHKYSDIFTIIINKNEIKKNEMKLHLVFQLSLEDKNLEINFSYPSIKIYFIKRNENVFIFIYKKLKHSHVNVWVFWNIPR
jgi:hypothetical protein